MGVFDFLLLDRAIEARADFFDTKHEAAFRLFNGFFEGDPELVVDLYADTILIQNYAEEPANKFKEIEGVVGYLVKRFDWIRAAVVKHRLSNDERLRNGELHFGERPATRLRENGVRYAFDLQLNRDAGFYLDTRLVRQWAQQELAGQTVLNCFAYTGSLGVAALAGGAERVVQTDLNKRFLSVAKESNTLNGFKINRSDFITGDFFSVVKKLKRNGGRFDTVFVDPPFFTRTGKGEIDLNRDTTRLINKVRPLVNDDGRIIMINNALFVSGQAFYSDLNDLCQDGYLEIEKIIPIGSDIIGYANTIRREPVTPTAPFNHSTKVLVMRVHHKKNERG